MYDRAPRSIGQTVGCTPEHIGPGSYYHARKKTHGGYAPFLSLSHRSDPGGNDESPGPGSYNPPTARITIGGGEEAAVAAIGLFRRTTKMSRMLSASLSSTRPHASLSGKGACTLSNRSSRFKEKPTTDVPGPGSYELNVNQSPRATFNDFTKFPRHNVLRITRQSLPPSIPDPRYCYGFEEDDQGHLVPQDKNVVGADTDQDVRNPVAHAENDSSKFYQGVHFGKYSSKRTDFAAKPSPGPGDYDIANPVKFEVHNVNAKLLDKRPALQVPRYPDSMLKAASKDGVPGPGQYSIKRDLDPEPPKLDFTGLETDRPAFGSQTQRFTNSSTTVPGPGAYNDQTLSLSNGNQTKPTSIKRVPFNQTTARFDVPEHRIRSMPGPGQYRITGFTDQNLRRVAIDNGRKPAFNVTSVRRLNMIRKDELNQPGPSTYDVKTEPFKPAVEQLTANFASNTARDLVIEDIPGPAAYDVPHAYQALVSQHRKSPRTKVARQRHGQFLSAAKRTYASDNTNDTPGPGTYDALATTRPHGYAPVRDPRFRSEIPKLPGPADYELSPLFQDTVLRGTFNSTLNNPILAKLQSRAQREDEAAATLVA